MLVTLKYVLMNIVQGNQELKDQAMLLFEAAQACVKVGNVEILQSWIVALRQSENGAP
jgi:hypothetical protein